MKLPPIIKVEAIGLADAYYKLVKACISEGAQKKREYGNTLDIVSLCEIQKPFLKPMLHPQFPTKDLHMQEYEKQWERGYKWKEQGFEYNYMDRLTRYPKIILPQDTIKEEKDYYHKSSNEYEYYGFIDQLEVIKERIAERISRGGEQFVSNRDRVITWIPDRDLFVDEDQPCLQSLQFFVYKYPSYYEADNEFEYGLGELHVVWRSRDLYTAWNSNMVGLVKMVKREIFGPNDIKTMRVIDFCNSLHIYESDWEAAKQIRPAVINPQLFGNRMG